VKTALSEQLSLFPPWKTDREPETRYSSQHLSPLRNSKPKGAFGAVPTQVMSQAPGKLC